MNNRITGVGTLDWGKSEHQVDEEEHLQINLGRVPRTPDDMCEERSNFVYGSVGWEVERHGGETEGRYSASKSVLPRALLHALRRLAGERSNEESVCGCWLSWHFENPSLVEVWISPGELKVRDRTRYICALARKLSRWCREYQKAHATA
jgi:hypothetical protein